MSDLKVNTELISGLAADLSTVQGQFIVDETFFLDYQEDLGHPELADRVEHYAKDWRNMRQLLLSEIKVLQATYAKIGESFSDTEAKLSGALDRSDSDSSATGSAKA